MDKLKNLHLLLRVPSFSRWPLQVRFFCVDVHRAWQGLIESVNGNVRGGIKVLLDLKHSEEIFDDDELPMSTKAKGKRKREALGKGGIEGLDVGYNELKNHVEKSISSLAEDKALKCAVCAKKLGSKTAIALVCSQENCRTASHIACLASTFIKDEGSSDAVTPISGRCPGCKAELQWIDLIKELSLRVRGEKEVAKITKKPRERKTKEPKAKNVQLEAHTFEEESVVDQEDDYVDVDIRAMDASADDSLPEDWYQGGDDEDTMSIKSGHSALSDGVEAASPTRHPAIVRRLPAVIEDSELEEEEFLD